jgi:14-3-3 protein epsilon
MMGDYHRYLAEFTTGDRQKDSADKFNAYKATSDVTVTKLLAELPPTCAIHIEQLSSPSTSPYSIMKF